MKKIKVLLFHDVYEHIGGAETYVFNLEKELEDKVDLYTFYQSFKMEKEEKRRTVYKNKKMSSFEKLISYYFFDYRFNRYFKRILKKINPDIIHLNHNNLHPFDIFRLSKKHKLIQTIHDYGVVCPKIWGIDNQQNVCTCGPSAKCIFSGCLSLKNAPIILLQKLRKYLMKKEVDLFISPSQKLKNILNKDGFEKVKVLNYFIDLNKWRKLNKGSIYQKEKKTILYVGGLTRQKGVHILLEAVSKLPKEALKNINLKIVGEGNYKSELVKMTQKLGLANIVYFVGYKNGQELKSLYKPAYMLVVPSIWLEQFGIIGLEAMASSTPVIGSNIGGIPEWLEDGKNGLLFTPGDSTDLAKKISFLLTSPQKAEEYGVNGRKIVGKFSKERHIKGLLKIYKEILKWKKN